MFYQKILTILIFIKFSKMASVKNGISQNGLWGRLVGRIISGTDVYIINLSSFCIPRVNLGAIIIV